MTLNTMKVPTAKSFLPLGLVLAGVMVFSAPALAECGTFPKVPWWGNLTPEKVASYVVRRHHGNWKPYIRKWAAQVDNLKNVHLRQSSVYVRYKGKKVQIAGDALANYIKLVEKRVAVTRCLAHTERYTNFATAAGSKSKTTGKDEKN